MYFRYSRSFLKDSITRSTCKVGSDCSINFSTLYFKCTQYVLILLVIYSEFITYMY